MHKDENKDIFLCRKCAEFIVLMYGEKSLIALKCYGITGQNMKRFKGG